MSETLVSDLRTGLLSWFSENKRELPWRGQVDPYAIWVSEIMLQQTQAATVVEYYTRWMAEYPTIEALAASERDDVMRMWAGLGYYRRARLLHEAAATLARGTAALPETRDELLKVAGIGRYTAAAIASIAYSEPVAVVDGNVKRVLARLFVIGGDPAGTVATKRFWKLAQDLVDPDFPGDFNQAMMELGATVCRPRPLCESCPVAWACQARATGEERSYPERKPAKSARVETAFVAVGVSPTGAYWLTRGATELLGGLWGFETFGSEAEACRRLSTSRPEEVGSVRHKFTHIDMTYRVFRSEVHGWVSTESAKWVVLEALEQLPVSVAMKKVAALLSDG